MVRSKLNKFQHRRPGTCGKTDTTENITSRSFVGGGNKCQRSCEACFVLTFVFRTEIYIH